MLEKAWKEVKFRLFEGDSPESQEVQIVEAARALADGIRGMMTFPFEVLPTGWPDVDMATLVDPETGLSLRGRRWKKGEEQFMAFDICSEGFVGPVPYLGPWLTEGFNG